MKGTEKKNLLSYLDISAPKEAKSNSTNHTLAQNVTSSANSTAKAKKEDEDTTSYIKFTKLPEMKPLISEWMGSFDNLHNNGTQFFFQTNYNAPNSKIIKIDINDLSAPWTEVIPENSNMIMESSSVMHNKFVIKYLVNASDSLQIFDLGENSKD